jgi:hypothetical protein
MNTYRVFHRPTLMLGAMLVMSAAACSKDKQTADNALGQDSALTRDLELANKDTTAQPQLRDVPSKETNVAQSDRSETEKPRLEPKRPNITPRVAPKPVAKTPPPPTPPTVIEKPQEQQAAAKTENANAGAGAAPKGPMFGSVESGATIAMASGQRMCTNTNVVGDRFTATILDPVQGTNGVSIPSGATAVLEITELHQAKGPRDSVIVRFAVKSISFGGKSYDASGEIVDAAIERKAAQGNNDGKKVAAGAALGAIAGQIFGKKTKSTVIGAAAGAAVGAGAAIATAKYDGCVPLTGRIVMKLTQPIQIQVAGAQ